jgi:hypothetical protein
MSGWGGEWVLVRDEGERDEGKRKLKEKRNKGEKETDANTYC